MKNELLDNFEELREDLFKLFIYCFIENSFFEIEDIISKDMFNLLTSWKQPLWDLFPREIHDEGIEWYIEAISLGLIEEQVYLNPDERIYTMIFDWENDVNSDMLHYPVKVKITKVQE